MAERHFLDIAGLRYFARKMKESLAQTQRVVKSKNFLAELDSNELAILDNSQFAYPAGAGVVDKHQTEAYLRQQPKGV